MEDRENPVSPGSDRIKMTSYYLRQSLSGGDDQEYRFGYRVEGLVS